MAFLNKKEISLITLINANESFTSEQRGELIKEINNNARLRSDQYRKPVKVLLSVLSSFKTDRLVANTLK